MSLVTFLFVYFDDVDLFSFIKKFIFQFFHNNQDIFQKLQIQTEELKKFIITLLEDKFDLINNSIQNLSQELYDLKTELIQRKRKKNKNQVNNKRDSKFLKTNSGVSKNKSKMQIKIFNQQNKEQLKAIHNNLLFPVNKIDKSVGPVVRHLICKQYNKIPLASNNHLNKHFLKTLIFNINQLNHNNNNNISQANIFNKIHGFKNNQYLGGWYLELRMVKNSIKMYVNGQNIPKYRLQDKKHQQQDQKHVYNANHDISNQYIIKLMLTEELKELIQQEIKEHIRIFSKRMVTIETMLDFYQQEQKLQNSVFLKQFQNLQRQFSQFFTEIQEAKTTADQILQKTEKKIQDIEKVKLNQQIQIKEQQINRNISKDHNQFAQNHQITQKQKNTKEQRGPLPQDKQSNKIVYKCKTGQKFHRQYCKCLENSCIPINRNDEDSMKGLTACQVCRP